MLIAVLCRNFAVCQYTVFIRPVLFLKLAAILGDFTKFQNATISFFVSVCPTVRPSAQIKSVPNLLIYLKFDIGVFLENLREYASYLKI